MGKKGKKAQAGKPKKLTPKDVGKRLDVLAKKVEEELKGADLFAPLPPTEDCAICLVPRPYVQFETWYKACCGNTICKACDFESEESIKKQNEEKNSGKKLIFTCPFCREPVPEEESEVHANLKKRCLQNDHTAFLLMGKAHRDAEYGIVKDDLKALDCWIRAVELGSPAACALIANKYHKGNGVAINKERAALFERIGAMRGEIATRHNIGCTEYNSGNHEIGIRHFKIAAEAGYQDSLNALRGIYNGNRPGKEFISKDFLESTYRACHDAQMEVASEEREKHSGAK